MIVSAGRPASPLPERPQSGPSARAEATNATEEARILSPPAARVLGRHGRAPRLIVSRATRAGVVTAADASSQPGPCPAGRPPGGSGPGRLQISRNHDPA